MAMRGGLMARVRARAASTDCPEGDQSMASPAAKRPRASTPRTTKGIPAVMAATSSSSASALGAGENDMDTQESQNIGIGKECVGCLRQFGIDCSYLVAGTPLAWTYDDMKGSWCRDCYNLFKVMYKPRMNAPLFLRWLDKSPANRLQFMRMLVSYLSLKQDGSGHVSAAAVESRCKMISWLMDMLQVPWPTFRVRQVDSSFLSRLGEPTHFLAKSADGASAFGLELADVPTGSRACSHRFLVKKQAARQWPLMPWTTLPPSLEAGWQEHVGDAAYQVTDLAEEEQEQPPDRAVADSSDATALAPQAQTPKGLDAKALGAQQSVALLIDSLVKDGTEQTKERDFTPILTKALKLKQDVLDSSSSNVELVAIAEVVSNVCNAGKKLVRPLKEYLKSGKRSTLQAMHQNLKVVQEFAAQQGCEMGKEFGAAYMQAEFFALHSESCEKALDFVTRFNFAWAGGQLAHDSPLTPARLVHQCLMQVISEALRQPANPGDEATWDETKKQLLAAAEAYQCMLSRMMPSFPMLAPTLAVMDSYVTVLHAAMRKGTIMPSDVASAKKHIEQDPKAAHLKDALTFAGVGLSVAIESDAIVLKGAMDSQADDEHRMVLQTAFTDGMPDSGDCEDEDIVVDPALFMADARGQCHVVSLLLQAMRSSIAVLLKWSPVRISEESESLQALAEQAANVLSALDDFANKQCASNLHHAQAEWVAQLAKLPEWGVLASPMPELPREVDMTDVYKVVAHFAETLQSKASFDNDVVRQSAMLMGRLANFKMNAERRSALRDESVAMGMAMRCKLLEPRGLLEEYSVKDDGMLKQTLLVAEVRKRGPSPLVSQDLGKRVSYSSELPGMIPEEEVDSFWAHFEEGAAAQKLIDFVLPSALAVASSYIHQHLAFVSRMQLATPKDQWADATRATSGCAAFIKLVGGRNEFDQLTKDLREYLSDPQVFDAALNDSDSTVFAIVGGMQVSSAAMSLQRLVSASGVGEMSGKPFVKDGANVASTTVAQFVSLLSEVEAMLACIGHVVHMAMEIQAAVEEKKAVDRRAFPLLSALLSQTHLVLAEWPAKISLLRASSGSGRLAGVSLADLDMLADSLVDIVLPTLARESQVDVSINPPIDHLGNESKLPPGPEALRRTRWSPL